MEDREKEDKIKEEGQTDYLWADVTVKKTRRRGQKAEKPEAFMANFFKGLEIYQTKLLVSSPALIPYYWRCWPSRRQSWPLICVPFP
jgi:hypothetical protein